MTVLRRSWWKAPLACKCRPCRQHLQAGQSPQHRDQEYPALLDVLLHEQTQEQATLGPVLREHHACLAVHSTKTERLVNSRTPSLVCPDRVLDAAPTTFTGLSSSRASCIHSSSNMTSNADACTGNAVQSCSPASHSNTQNLQVQNASKTESLSLR